MPKSLDCLGFVRTCLAILAFGHPFPEVAELYKPLLPSQPTSPRYPTSRLKTNRLGGTQDRLNLSIKHGLWARHLVQNFGPCFLPSAQVAYSVIRNAKASGFTSTQVACPGWVPVS